MRLLLTVILTFMIIIKGYAMEIKKPFIIKVMGYSDCAVRLEVDEKSTFSYFISPAFSDYKENITIKIGKDEYHFFEANYPPCEWKKLKDLLANIYYNL